MTYELLRDKRFRVSGSRAYFTVYCALSSLFQDRAITFLDGWEGPRHSVLPDLVLHNLYRMDKRARTEMYGEVIKLYNLRILADYAPSVNYGEGEARVSIRLMNKILAKLEE